MKSKSKPKQSKKEIEAALFSADLDWDSAKSGQSAIDIFVPITLATTPLPGYVPADLTRRTSTQPLLNNATVEHPEAMRKPLAMREQTVSPGFPKSVSTKDSVSNAYAEALAEPLAMREQTVSNAYAEKDFEALVGKEKKLLFFVFKKCQILGALETSLITTEELRQLLEVSSERLRNVIYRLSQKGFLEVTTVKNGRSGWRKFQLRRELFQKLCFDPSVSNSLAMREQTVSIASPKAYAEALAGFSSSSSSIDSQKFKTTTTDEPELFNDAAIQLSPEWQEVECSPLSEIGFTQTHLMQIIRQNMLKPEVVQQSIYAFAFDLRVNGKAKEVRGTPLNYFMGTLRKGTEYAPPENYETPQAEARRKRLEFYERAERLKQEQEQKILDYEFLSWKRGLSESQIIALVPEWARRPGQIQDSALKSHFEEKVWPDLQLNISGSDENERQTIQKKIQRSLTEAAQ